MKSSKKTEYIFNCSPLQDKCHVKYCNSCKKYYYNTNSYKYDAPTSLQIYQFEGLFSETPKVVLTWMDKHHYLLSRVLTNHVCYSYREWSPVPRDTMIRFSLDVDFFHIFQYTNDSVSEIISVLKMADETWRNLATLQVPHYVHYIPLAWPIGILKSNHLL